ncbi:MAG: transposase [Candidatus Omnitrophica bacterium]|nr:transposase [Candidatus Omnitrophota bacterium]
MRRVKFVNDEIYHVYNRGVEKREIFLNNQNYFRFIHDLFEFNDESPAPNMDYYYEKTQSLEVRLPKIERRKPRKLLVEILAFCLMPNHFHLLLRQKRERGITEFMRKLGTGYTNYFNKKYKRVGALFQGKFKAVIVKKESHFLYLPYYIHLNPLELIDSDWKNGRIKDLSKLVEFLESYRWSSHLDYIGKKNFPSLTQREFLLEIFRGSEAYRKGIIRCLSDTGLEKIEEVILES